MRSHDTPLRLSSWLCSFPPGIYCCRKSSFPAFFFASPLIHSTSSLSIPPHLAAGWLTPFSPAPSERLGPREDRCLRLGSRRHAEPESAPEEASLLHRRRPRPRRHPCRRYPRWHHPVQQELRLVERLSPPADWRRIDVPGCRVHRHQSIIFSHPVSHTHGHHRRQGWLARSAHERY